MLNFFKSVTKQLLVAIDFLLCKSMATSYFLITNIFQNIFFVYNRKTELH